MTPLLYVGGFEFEQRCSNLIVIILFFKFFSKLEQFELKLTNSILT